MEAPHVPPQPLLPPGCPPTDVHRGLQGLMGGLSSPLHFLWGDICTYLISSHPTPHPPSHEFPSHHSSLPNFTIIYLKLVKPGYKRGGNVGGGVTTAQPQWLKRIGALLHPSVCLSCPRAGGCRGAAGGGPRTPYPRAVPRPSRSASTLAANSVKVGLALGANAQQLSIIAYTCRQNGAVKGYGEGRHPTVLGGGISPPWGSPGAPGAAGSPSAAPANGR